MTQFRQILLSEKTEHFLSTFDLASTLLSEKRSTIEVLKVGKVHDRGLEITLAMLDDYVTNWRNNAYGTELQVNFSHDREGKAAGWIKDLFREGDVLKATVEWTPAGELAVSGKEFRYISSELAPEYPEAKTGDLLKNVFIGCALTNVPAVKGMAPVSLSENLNLYFNQKDMSKVKEAHKALMAKEKLTKKDLEDFEEKCAEEEGTDSTELKKDLKKKFADQVEPDGDEGKGGKGDKDGDEEKAGAKDKKLAETVATVDLAEFNRTVAALAEERKVRVELEEKIARKDLSDMIKEKVVLSAENSVGIKNDEETISAFTNFALSLSKDQRAAFFDEILPKIQHVDLSVKGEEIDVVRQVKMSDAQIEKNADKITARAKVLLSEKKASNIGEAQKLAISEAKEGKL